MWTFRHSSDKFVTQNGTIQTLKAGEFFAAPIVEYKSRALRDEGVILARHSFECASRLEDVLVSLKWNVVSKSTGRTTI